MPRKKPFGWDIGGAESPVSLDLEIIDIQNPVSLHYHWFGYRDVRAFTWHHGLEPRRYVYVGRLLRYLETRDYTKHDARTGDPALGEIRDPMVYDQMAHNLAQIVLPGGVLQLFDSTPYLQHMAVYFGERVLKWHVGSREVINPAEEGMPEECNLFIIRPILES